MTLIPVNRRQDRHSRRVRILKLALPLIAVAILSSLFLFSRGVTMEGALPFAELDIEDRLSEPKMTDVRIATTSKNGALIDLAANEITPVGTSGATASNASGTITAPSGQITELTAPQIDYDADGQTAALLGGVRIASAGYVMTTEALDVTLASAGIDSRSAVRAIGPLGQVDAGRMSLRQNDGKFVLVFNSGVRLLYVPQQ